MSHEIYKCFDCFKDFSFLNDNNYPTIDCIEMKKNICFNCLENYYNKIDESYNNNQKTEMVKNENEEKYDKFFKALQSNHSPSEEQLDNDIETMNSELSQLLSESKENEETLSSLIQEYISLTQKEEKFWNDFNVLEKNIYLQEKKKSIIENQSQILRQEIKNCAPSNIFSDLFIITFSDKLGTINGCRMGEASNSNNYDEINAGWGYIIFLSKILSCKFGFESNRYELESKGNYSKINTKANNKIYEVSLSDNSRTLDKFNESMKVFLDYIQEFYNYLETYNKVTTLKSELEFKISNDAINGKSIILEQNKPEDWAQSIKYILTFLKYLITQVLKAEDDEYKKIIEKASLVYSNPVITSKK